LVAACSDDDDPGAETTDRGGPPAESADPVIIEVTAPLELGTALGTDFVTGVLDDDTVTADEVADAYDRYIQCLADGGAAGIYAFDLSLRVAFADWSLASAGSDANDQAELAATCSRNFLGDLIVRYEAANPPEADLAERQRDSVVRCVAAIDPELATGIPDVITLDTTGEGAYVGDLQLDASSLGDDAGQSAALSRCIGSLGAELVPFG
jgi:hypothetical protein